MSASPDAKPSETAQRDFGRVEIDRGAEVPIGVQLAWALRSRIDDGRLAPGQRLPALRDLAEASSVNVNTVRAVYQRLEQEGRIDSHQGSGTFVAVTPRPRSSVSAIAASAAREALETGVDPREVAAALYVSPEGAPAGADQARERRRTLRAQIGVLERTLSEMEAAHPGVSTAPDQGRRWIGPALLSVEELEQVRGLLVRRLSAAQARLEDQGDEPAAARKTPARSARKRTQPVPPTAEPKRRPSPRPSTRPAPAGT
jgi:GntR family transcriptional regulator